MIGELINEWLKELLVGGIIDNLAGLFDNVNDKVADIAGQVGSNPQAWNGSIYSMIRNLSENVIVPIAGVILAFVMTLELIQLVTDRNNLHDVDTWLFFKWIFKTACAVLIVTHTWTIVMGVFVMLPFFLLAMYEKNGLPLEKIIRNILRVYFLRPKQRPYQTDNFYAVLERQANLDKEVFHIVHPKKVDPRREKADRGRHRKSETAG